MREVRRYEENLFAIYLCTLYSRLWGARDRAACGVCGGEWGAQRTVAGGTLLNRKYYIYT